MKSTHENRVIGFREVFKIAMCDLAQAKAILNDITIIPSDLDVLIGYMKSSDSRYLAAELVKKIDNNTEIADEELDFDVLVELQKLGDSGVQGLAAELVKKIDTNIAYEELDFDVLMELQKSGDSAVRSFATELVSKIDFEKRRAEILKFFE